MPRERDYKFIVVVKGDFIPGAFGEWLNTFGWTDCVEVHFKIGTAHKDGFYVPHAVITRVKNQFSAWKNNFEFYQQEGQGEIRPYTVPGEKDSAAMKKAKADLAKLKARK